MKKITTKNTEEYFKIPKKERTNKWGWYIPPSSLPFDFKFSEWDKLSNGLKKEFPVQWFFREKMGDFFSINFRRLKDFKHSIKKFVSPNHKRFRKSYKRTDYKDLCTLLPDAIFAAFLDFWYEEVYPESIVDWSLDWESREYADDQLGQFEKESAKKHCELYKWMEKIANDIEVKLPSLAEEISKELDRLSEIKSDNASYKEQCKKYESLEKKHNEEETRIMEEIIEKRDDLWT